MIAGALAGAAGLLHSAVRARIAQVGSPCKSEGPRRTGRPEICWASSSARSAAIAVITVWSPFFRELAFPIGSKQHPLSHRMRELRLLVTGVGFAVALVGYIYPVMRYLHRAEHAGISPRAMPRATCR